MTHVLRCSGYELVKTDIVHAQGCSLYDAQGKRYVDFEAGVWCAALGYNHPRVNRAIREQLERVAHIGYRYTADVVEEAAAAVLSTLTRHRDAAATIVSDSSDTNRGRGIPMPRSESRHGDAVATGGGGSDFSDGKCVFLSSGSEAVEFGVQVARRLSERPLLLALSDAYLAAYGSAGRKDPAEWHSFDWTACAACPHAETCDPQCPHILAIPFDRIGGLVFEPGSSSGLVRFPPTGLVQILARRVVEQGGLIVVDEVTTGLGRTGAWYGFEHYGLAPDVVALGKGLGNGYPVSAAAMCGAVAERLMVGDFHYAQSHQNDPLGCAVAKEVIAVLSEGRLIEHSAQVGERLLRELAQCAARQESVREVRGRGLMAAIEFDGSAEMGSVTEVYHELVQRGHLVGCKPAANLLRFYPPLILQEDDILHLGESLSLILDASG
jgi:acetylornithine aminotransferase